MPQTMRPNGSIDIKDLYAGRQRRLSVDLGENEDGESLAITLKWSPEKYTKEVHAAIAEANLTKDPFLIAEAVIVPLVTWWDLADGGKPYPITTANVEKLGLFIETQMMLAISRDFEGPANLKGTSGGSSSASPEPDSVSPTGT